MRSILDDIGDGGALQAQDSVRALREATLAQLRDLCETVRGSVLVAPDYGFEDATHIFHEFPRSKEEARHQLEVAIRRYVPHLAEASVELEEEEEHGRGIPDLVLRFVVSAVMTVDGRRVPVRFTSVLRSDKLFEFR